MTKLTFVSTRIPFPPDKDGFTENIFHIIQSLKDQYSVHIRYIFFGKQMGNWEENEFEKHVDELIFEIGYSKYLFPIFPFLINKYENSTPVLFCDFNSGYYQNVIGSDNKILYAADSQAFYRSKRKDVFSKLLFFKFIIEESFLYRKFKNIIFVSDLDVEYTKGRTNGRGIQIPIGYNLSRSFGSTTKKFDLVFSGNFNFFPNKEAAEFFLIEIFEDIKKLFPYIKVCFVGRNPSSLMKKYANNFKLNIVVTGEVDKVEIYLAQSKIYFSPLLSGSGMKNKILQAMASSLPIVCTIESLSGFLDYNRYSVIVSNTQLSLKSSLIEMLNKSDLELEKMGQSNREYINNNYSWSSIVKIHYSNIFNI
ncbi:glycosyltransferase [Algoriphagus yeomjeoni]|uniref:Glycosyltransferase involved in cell wall biosynthesis n=1 Tax=Algoriphagus yeomjeoni TaxID=291403 RepID=A0A327PHE8_9BACT|nr:glycosyltransferase [Algoriphagus yeomjeoni]RAI91659.1 glycosyltransferase involved in cell wall biosynthesis [Algoriphagus yeomjeoni]